MIRVLHLIDSLVAGGKERQFLEVLKGLEREREIICHAVVMSYAIQYDGFYRLQTNTTVLPRSGRYDMSMWRRLRTVVSDFSPDIVQSWNTMCSVYGAPLARLAGAKFIDGFVRKATAGLTMRDPDYFRSRFTLPLTDVVVGNSRAGLRAYCIPAKKAVCIHNGFDSSRLDTLVAPEEVRASLGITTRHVIGMIAAFSPRKDYATFFRAAKCLTGKRDDVTFLAIGDGRQLPRFEAAFPPDKHPMIRILGPRSDVESIANIFSVGVLLSNSGVHGEGISNALMECMALGKPVVATDCGGNRELVEEGETGFLIGDGDCGALVSRLQLLLDDDALAFRLGKAARRRIRERFGMEEMTQNYVSLYRELMARAA